MKRSIFLLSSIIITGLNPLEADQEGPIFRESVELRQIADYWKEREYRLAKEHIYQFLQNYPNTLFKEQLYAMLADLLVKEQNYEKAIEFYEKISPEKRSQSTLFHYVYCLYHLGMWEEVIDQAPSVIRHASTTKEQLDVMRFSFADALMQNALQAEDNSHRKDMLLQAESEFKKLLNTRYACDSLQSIAHINIVLENPLQAANLYLTLAEKDSANKEQYLFQAGYLQIPINPNKAIELLEQVCELKQEKSSRAAYLLLQILFQEKQYAKLLNIHDKFNDLIPSNPLVSYYIGKSLYQTNNPDLAISFLTQSLESSSIDVSYKKSAVITLISCAKITRNWFLLEEKLKYLIDFFPEETQTLDLILMYTELCKQEKNWEKMTLYLKKALEIHPNCPQKESLIYEQALCSVYQQKLEEAVDILTNFLNDFPDSSHVKQAWRQLLNCCMQDVKNSSLALYPKKQALLITHLTRALEQKDLFLDHERKDIHWLLIQSFFERKNYQKAFDSLKEYVKHYGNSSDTYLFIALCQEHLDVPSLQIAENFEQVLQDPQTAHRRFCNRKLYNLYLSIAQEVPEEEKNLSLKAADCLFANIDEPIEINNLDWLADFYYQQFEKAEREQKIFYAKRAEISFEKLLNHRSLPIEPELELEVLKLCTLYNYLGEKSKKIPLLKTLIQQQQKFPQIEWKWQRRALFELAISYQEQNLYKDAIQLYDVLIDSSRHVLSYYGTAALLEKARLQFSLLADEEKQEGSLEIMAICDALKEVQVRKKLLSEPLHLEAGLEYIRIKTCISDNPMKKKLDLLLQMKESFSSRDDASVQHYLSTQDLFPDKMQLYQDYLSFIDLEITSIKALLAKENRKENLYQKLKTSALVKLDELEAKILHESLQTRVQMSKEALQAIL